VRPLLGVLPTLLGGPWSEAKNLALRGGGEERGRIAALQALTPSVVLRGLLPNASVSVVAATWFGDNAVELTFKAPDGKVAQEVVFRHAGRRLKVVEAPLRATVPRTAVKRRPLVSWVAFGRLW